MERRPLESWGCHMVMDGGTPARVPDRIIEEIRSRERGGLVELPKPPGLRRGERSGSSGPFEDHLALYRRHGEPRPRGGPARVLGGQQRTELPAAAVEAVR